MLLYMKRKNVKKIKKSIKTNSLNTNANLINIKIGGGKPRIPKVSNETKQKPNDRFEHILQQLQTQQLLNRQPVQNNDFLINRLTQMEQSRRSNDAQNERKIDDLEKRLGDIGKPVNLPSEELSMAPTSTSSASVNTSTPTVVDRQKWLIEQAQRKSAQLPNDGNNVSASASSSAYAMPFSPMVSSVSIADDDGLFVTDPIAPKPRGKPLMKLPKQIEGREYAISSNNAVFIKQPHGWSNNPSTKQNLQVKTYLSLHNISYPNI